MDVVQSNYGIQCTKLQHDIDNVKRRVENAKMKLTAEMKVRCFTLSITSLSTVVVRGRLGKIRKKETGMGVGWLGRL